MYAPKLKSWLTSWDRFDMILDFKISESAKRASEEMAGLISAAKAEFAPPIKLPTQDTGALHLQYLQYLQSAMGAQASPNPYISQLAERQQSPWQSMGDIFGGLMTHR